MDMASASSSRTMGISGRARLAAALDESAELKCRVEDDEDRVDEICVSFKFCLGVVATVASTSYRETPKQTFYHPPTTCAGQNLVAGERSSPLRPAVSQRLPPSCVLRRWQHGQFQQW